MLAGGFGQQQWHFSQRPPVAQPTLLQDGDRVEIGATALRFRQPTPNRPGATRNPTADATVMAVKFEPCWLLVADIVGST